MNKDIRTTKEVANKIKFELEFEKKISFLYNEV